MAKRNWKPACGGNETPFTYGGEQWLYVWNGERHGYLRLSEDVVYTDFRAPRQVT